MPVELILRTTLCGEVLVRYIATFAAAVVLASPVSAHHSDAGLNMNSLVTFEGTVTGFNWRNPHVYFTVETTDERGELVRTPIACRETRGSGCQTTAYGPLG